MPTVPPRLHNCCWLRSGEAHGQYRSDVAEVFEQSVDANSLMIVILVSVRARINKSAFLLFSLTQFSSLTAKAS